MDPSNQLIKIRNFIILGGLIILSGVGCTSLQSFPNAARAGDTVALAIGSPDGMDKANTTAVYVSQSDPATQHALPIRSIFKLYADKASEQYELNNLNTNIVNTSGHEAWVTIAAIDLPTTLPDGPGEVIFSSPTSVYPTVGSHIDDLPISLEILPSAGTGSPANYAATFPFELGSGSTSIGNLSTLEPQEHSVVFPDPVLGIPGPYNNFGAIELEIDLQTSKGTALKERTVRALLDDMTPLTNSRRSVSSSVKANSVTGGATLKVMILSPTGNLRYYEARLTIVLNNGITFTSPPTISAVNYYDLNGVVATGPSTAQYTIEQR